MKLLILLFLVIGLMAADAPPATRPVTRKDVGVDEFEKLWKEKKGVVLDVRTAREYQQGHIPGSINVDINATDFQKKVAALEKEQTYLIHCASGVRSVRACDKMNRLDFKQLVNLQGGMKAWEKAGKPVEK